jgi:NADPH-dependent 2,4-dienoyl-CoA reductase/sulfur reductase-like enzyme
MTEAEKSHSYKKETALTKPRVVIVGGGFGGLCAARGLAGAPVSVTLIDKRNYHLFRPMLYQVATGLLSADQISGAAAIDPQPTGQCGGADGRSHRRSIRTSAWFV